MMGGRHKQILDVIILQCLHTLDALASAVLALEVVRSHSLNISKFGHCDHCILSRNQILCRNIVYIISDRSLSVVSVFLCNCKNFFPNHAKKKTSVRKDSLVFTDFFH